MSKRLFVVLGGVACLLLLFTSLGHRGLLAWASSHGQDGSYVDGSSARSRKSAAPTDRAEAEQRAVKSSAEPGHTERRDPRASLNPEQLGRIEPALQVLDGVWQDALNRGDEAALARVNAEQDKLVAATLGVDGPAQGMNDQGQSGR